MNKTKTLIAILLVVTISMISLVFSGSCAGPEKPDRFNELLSLIPAIKSVKKNVIIICDSALAFESVGISLAELDEQSTTFQEFTDLLGEKSIDLSKISNLPTSFITGWGKYADSGPICDKNVGYSSASIDAYIQAGEPPNLMEAAIGRYDPIATRDALQNQEKWPSWAVEAYDSEEYNGVTIHTWGDGHEIHLIDALVPPHIDSLGRAMPLAVTDEYLFCSTSLEYVRTMIFTRQGKMTSLADLPQYAEITAKMSELGVYSILLGNESLVNGYPKESDIYSGPLLKKFVTFGSAPGNDEKGRFIALVLYHENPDDAQDNVSLLEERIASTNSVLETPWNDMIYETDIKAEGNLLIAKLYTEQRNLWAAWVYNYDSLILHETT